MKEINELYYRLGKNENYDCQILNVWPYNKVTDIIEDNQLSLSNMAGGYPFIFNDVEFRSNEILYLLGEFSENIEIHKYIQEQMQTFKSGFAAKMFIKNKYKEYIRKDFEEFRLDWMIYVVWQKCLNNENFGQKLLSIPDDAILVEDTTKNKSQTRLFWGASNTELFNKRQEKEDEIKNSFKYKTKKELNQKISIEINKIRNIGVYNGQNNMGKILMLCRECLRQNITPPYNAELLNNKRIYINSQLLIF